MKRYSAVLAIVLVIAGFFVAMSVQADHGSQFINLTFNGATVNHNGAIFTQGGIGAGTGNFDPFLTYNANTDQEEGYNSTKGTPGIPQFDEFYGGGRTHALRASAIPTFDIGGTLYRVILLDANDTGADPYNSIDKLKVYLDDQPNLAGYNYSADTFSNDTGTAAVLKYNMDANCPGSPTGDCILLMNSQGLQSGSGQSDISVALLNSLFPANCYYGSTTCDQWFYLYTHMGGYDGVTPAPPSGLEGLNWNVTAGFEEWRTELIPVVNVTKTAAVSYTETFDWTLDKQVSTDGGATWHDADSVVLESGDSQNYLWRLVATRLPAVVSNQVISGTVTISNPTGGTVISDSIPATVTSIADNITFDDATPAIPNVTLNCPEAVPFTLAAGESVDCTYSVTATGASATTTGTNHVTVHIEDNDTPFIASDGFDFASATVTQIDEQATLSDAEVVTPDQLISASQTFMSSTQTYTCGSSTTITNTGSLTENDSNQFHQDTATLTIKCVDASITITPSGANEVGDSHQFTITVTAMPGGASPVSFDSITPSVSPTPDSMSDTCDSPVVSGNSATCTVTINNDNAGVFTANASADVTMGGLTVTRSTSGNSGPGGSGAVTKVYADAFITIEPDGTNFIHESHTFTVHVEANDGTGFADVAGVNPTVSLNNSSGATATITDNQCQSVGTDSNGDCTITISSPTTGQTSAHASVTLTVSTSQGTVSLTRQTNGLETVTGNGVFNSDDALKTWIAAAVTFTKTFDVGNITTPGGTVCFTLTRVPAPPPAVSSDNATQCKAAAASVSFTWNNLVAGVHTITEDSSGVTPAGVYTDISPIVFTVVGDAADCPAAPATCVVASSSPTAFDLGSHNDPLAPGRLQVKKLLGPAGTLWTADLGSVTFYVCQNSPFNNSTPDTTCGAASANLVDTIVIPDDGNPATSEELDDEGYYTVCEDVPLGYDVSPSACQAVLVTAGEQASANEVVFTNTRPSEGCTPGFWSGGFGSQLWNTANDPDWSFYGGDGTNPFTQSTLFNSFFTAHPNLNGLTMLQIVGTGGGSDPVRKAARDVVAAYLNAAWGLDYPFTTSEVASMWTDAVANGTFAELHNILAPANQLGCNIP